MKAWLAPEELTVAECLTGAGADDSFDRLTLRAGPTDFAVVGTVEATGADDGLPLLLLLATFDDTDDASTLFFGLTDIVVPSFAGTGRIAASVAETLFLKLGIAGAVDDDVVDDVNDLSLLTGPAGEDGLLFFGGS